MKYMPPLLGRDIAEKVEAQCFNNEEKETLKIERGTGTLTVKDQFNVYYEEAECIYNEETTLKKIMFIIEENKHLIDDIKELGEKIKEIKTPGNYAENTTTTARTTDEITSKGTSDAVGASSYDSESSTDNKHKALNRDLRTQTSELLEGAEAGDDGRQLIKEGPKKKRRLNTERALTFDARDIGTEEETTKEETEPKKSPVPKYNDVGMVVSGDDSISSTLSRSDSGNALKNKSTGETSTTREGSTRTTKERRAEDTLKSLTVSIPRIRHQFWAKFQKLFKSPTTCTPW